MVLGRPKNQSNVDGKIGGHGVGGTLDNRSRVLQPLDTYENNSGKRDIGQNASDGFIGVHFSKHANKYRAQISNLFNHYEIVHLGMFENSDLGTAAGAVVFTVAIC
jgi:hypothetical protein